MTNAKRKTLRLSLLLATLVGVGALFIADKATGKGVVTIMNKKGLPESTLSVIDPEGGTSTGTVGSEVNLASGDIIVFRFQVTPAPDGISTGINHYLTEYVPDNLEVVGVRLTDENGKTIKPNLPGLAYDGCRNGSCNGSGNGSGNYNVPCSTGTCTKQSGSVAQVYGDTGVFYTFDTRLRRNPATSFLLLTSGAAALAFDTADKEPEAVLPVFNGALGISSVWYAHNTWDFLQSQSFGTQGPSYTSTGGQGNPPYLYGSPVAGTGAGYNLEATQGAGGLLDPELNDVTGPWLRARYPGSTVGQTQQNVGTGGADATRRLDDASGSGTDITPNNSLAEGATLRIATGSLAVGRPVFVEVAARVDADFDSDLFIDPVQAANVNCGEVFGGGSDDDLVWPYFAPDPQCVILRAIVDVTANDPLAPASNANISFGVRVENLAVLADENVVLRVQNNQGRAMNFSGIGGGVLESPCQAIDTTQSCTRFNIGTLQPSEERTFTVNTTSGGMGAETLFLKVNYSSGGNSGQPSVVGPLALPGFTSQDISQVRLVGVPRETISWNATSATPGATTPFTGTIRNVGVDTMDYQGLRLTLPTGWSVAGNSITVNGQSRACTPNGSSTPTCAFSNAIAPGGIINYAFSLNVPGGTTQGNYTFDAEWFIDLGSLAPSSVYDRDFATVSVGAVRSTPPVLNCPLTSSGSTTITGTSVEAPGSQVCVFINLVNRGCSTVQGDGSWSVDVSAFGELYAGLEVTAAVTGTGENQSVYSAECPGGVTNTRQCSDGVDNDLDGFTDFPADPGCVSPNDNTESPDLPAPECSNLTQVDPPLTPPSPDDDNDGDIDFGEDLQCHGPDDDDEANGGQCSDGMDNDLDGFIDGADPSCSNNPYDSERDYAACQNGINDDGGEDSLIDYPNDPGCHSPFDDDETDLGPPSAQIKPRVLVVFDTSGSMNSHACALPPPGDLETDFTGGDGSTECAGDPVSCGVCDPSGGDPGDSCNNALPDDSRIFKVKEGISDVVASFGDVEYALMRFKQRPQAFGCPGTANNFGSGSWLGGGVSPCTPFDEGEVVVSFAKDNVQSYLKWIDHDSNYGELNPGGNDDSLQTPFGLDFELRGTGSTPLAGALDSARSYVYGEIQDGIDASDPAADCRPYRIILVTDGLESCGGDPATEAARLFNPTGNGITLPGGGTAPSIPVTVIGFASDNGDLQTGLNTIAQAGSGQNAIIVSDEAALSNAIAEIVAGAIVTEICDGTDNDCDSVIDEGFGLYQGCDNDLVNSCFRDGDLRCDPDDVTGVVCCETPATENGGTAEILESNVCAEVVETDIGALRGTEVCNLEDDDCDVLIDEDPDVGPPLNCNCSPVELCDNLDNDCDGEIDEGTLPGEGIFCGSDVGVCEAGLFQCCRTGDIDCTVGQLYCDGEVGGGLENDVDLHCDDLDNDCDGITDEPVEACYDGTTTECPTGMPCNGICRRGLRSCEPDSPFGPTECEGQVLPETEVCNGVDDDCDGTVDEGQVFDPTPGNPGSGDELGLGETCSNGAFGICAATGTVVCNLAGEAVCTAPTITPQAEVCDNVDNDCDNSTDEEYDWDPDGPDPQPAPDPDVVGDPIGEACGGQGACGAGRFDCVNGRITCVGLPDQAGTEVCNGIDDDCDTLIDETFPEDGNECTPAGNAPDGRPYSEIGDTGECEFGAVVCVDGDLSCNDYKGPTDEVCDGKDNDCDGTIDDSATCDATGEICESGACVAPCQPGEFPCGFGFYCAAVPGEGNFCLPDPCTTITCQSGFFCDSDLGQCVDLCGDVECLEGAFCQNGFCLDCFTVPCPDGQACRRSENGVGLCEDTGCGDVECESDEVCIEGSCLPVDCDGECADDERCVNGVCEDDPCDGVVCPSGRICRATDGECVLGTLCNEVECGNGQACDPGTGDCIADPCIGIDCPVGTACFVDGPGLGVCREPKGDRVFAGGGGCSTGGDSTQTSAMLLLLALGALIRHRRLQVRENP